MDGSLRSSLPSRRPASRRSLKRSIKEKVAKLVPRAPAARGLYQRHAGCRCTEYRMGTTTNAVQVVRAGAEIISPDSVTFPSVTERLAAAKIVLLGAATHGTHEFYRVRAAITHELIERHGFAAVV